MASSMAAWSLSVSPSHSRNSRRASASFWTTIGCLSVASAEPLGPRAVCNNKTLRKSFAAGREKVVKPEVTKIARNPTYTYNPKYDFKGVHSDKKFTIKPGPNNPVGLVWIALTGEGYGIHGTPDPDHVGKTASHGCIRLTNWDALDLASKVDRNTPVEFLEQ